MSFPRIGASRVLCRSRRCPILERLEDRAVPASAAVAGFGGNAQHTSDYQPAAQTLNVIKWQTPVDLQPQYSGSDLLIHYGAPLITPSNTVLVAVKTGATDGFEVNAYDGATGAARYTLSTDYTLPTHDWTPSYSPGLVTTASGTRLYYAGAGGSIYFINDPDSSTPSAPVQQVFYTSLADYQANASAFNASVFIDTPITGDAQGDVYFGFRVEGTAPAPLNTTQSGYARIDAAGNATYVLAGDAAEDGSIAWDNHNAAPALSPDGKTLYVVVKSAADWSTYGYLLALDSTTLATKEKVFLTDPVGGGGAGILDDSTASPMVGPDGDVYLGVMGNPYNGSRGYLLHFDASLAPAGAPGGFGWDNTAAIVPAAMVPSYTGTSSYLLFTKYNNYANANPGSGDGVNRAAVLDPHAVETDPRNDGDPTLPIMREVLTVAGPTVDLANRGPAYPNAVREWCINTAAVDPALDAVFFPSEDGNLYRWCLKDDQLMQAINLAAGIGQAYVPTVLGPDGTVYTISNATLLAVGQQPGDRITITSSQEDVRGTVVGDSVTFTARVANTSSSGGTPAGTITFEDTTGGTTTILDTVDLDANGQATYMTSSLPSGGRFIAAAYSGGGGFAAGMATLVQFVHASASVTALGASPNPAPFGQPVTLTATVTAVTAGLPTPTGLVTFMEGPTFLGQVPLEGSGTATVVVSNFAVGRHTITAFYQSDPVYAMSQGDDAASPLVVKLVQNATSLSISTAPNPSVFGEPVDLLAQVTDGGSGTGIPAGTVTFSEGATILAAGVPVDAAGYAITSLASLAVGSHVLTATFTGAPGWLASSADDKGTPQVVNQAATATAVASSANPSIFGQSIRLSATVTAVAPGAGTPSGTVHFVHGSTILGVATLNASGVATLSLGSLPGGSDTITAVYGGSANFVGSASATFAQVVNLDETRVALSVSNLALVVGQTLAWRAVVSVVSPGAGPPSGSVTFYDATSPLGQASLNGGVATLWAPLSFVGRHLVTAAFSGDTSHVPSTSPASAIRVGLDATRTVVTFDPASPFAGQPVTITATVSALVPGSGTPAGRVTLVCGTRVLGTVALSGGVATLPWTYRTAGSATISAVYSGDSNDDSSRGTGGLVVQPHPTTTTLVSSAPSAPLGQPITFWVAVSPARPGTGRPTGDVVFLDDNVVLAIVPVIDGAAAFTTSFLTRGTHRITAVYLGDGNDLASSASILVK